MCHQLLAGAYRNFFQSFPLTNTATLDTPGPELLYICASTYGVKLPELFQSLFLLKNAENEMLTLNQKLQSNALAMDFSWDKSAGEYRELYNYILGE